MRRARTVLGVARHVAPWVDWLRSERPDVVVTSTATNPAAAVASAVVGIPHVWWVPEFVTRDHGLDYALGEPMSQRLIGWLSASVVACSQAVRDHFSPPIPSRKMRVIGYGFTGFDPSPNIIDPSTLRVLLLGRQTPTKGPELALEAVAIVGREPRRIELRLVGPIDGAYRARLRQLASTLGIASSDVEIVDATVTPQDELAWANVVLMCSDDEAFGRVTAEALTSGRPVVGTRSGGTVELISSGVDGFLFEPGDAHGLAGALRRLAGDPDLLAHMSVEASTRSRDRFTIAAEVEAFVDVLSSASGTRAAVLPDRR
jgi:glycosyltransferase involved in cell wall biosynthesis